MADLMVEEVSVFAGIPLPDVGAPDANVQTGENSLLLSYFSNDDAFIPRSLVPNSIRDNDSFLVRLSFYLPFWHSFGYPNDEALAGHPLFARGLSYYQPHLVRNSSLIERFRKQNLVNFPNSSNLWNDCRHLVFTFKDETFECVFSGLLKVEIVGADTWSTDL